MKRCMKFQSTSFECLFIGDIFFALTTRTWATSLAIVLMIMICHSTVRAQQYSWFYHLFGWIVPLCFSLFVYFYSSIDSRKFQPTIETEKFGRTQVIVSLVLLAACFSIGSICLLRIARRTYRLRQVQHERHHSNFEQIEGQPLIINDDDDDDDNNNNNVVTTATPLVSGLFTHSILC
jgi:hypothetical protein